MTINELQRKLIKEIERLTADMELVNKHGERTALKGYSQAIPMQPVFSAVPYEKSEEIWQEEEGNEALFPYFVVRVDGASYRKQERDGRNQAHIMVAFAVYDEDPYLRGYYTLTSIMERIVGRFLENPVLGEFFCKDEICLEFQEDDTYPHFFGGIEMFWDLPDVVVSPVVEEFL